MRREDRRAAGDLPDNDNRPHASNPDDAIAKTADRFRRLTIWLILVSAIIAVAMVVGLRIRVDPRGTSILECLLGILLLASRMWWNKAGHTRMADACGTVAVVAIGGLSCGAIAMAGLRAGYPLADVALRSWDHTLGIDGIAVVDSLFHQGEWLFWIMAPAYNFTMPIFFGSLLLLAGLGDRVEAWRAAFCFVGTLLTTCLIAMFVPAKGIGVWAPQGLLAHLPPQSMRSFWAHFDEFYFGAAPVLRMQVVDGVVSFPSFHSVVGFLVLAMWRTRLVGYLAAGTWLIFMMLGTFPGGGHYFVDLVAGFIVWAGWFALSLQLENRNPVPVLAWVPETSDGAG